MIAKLFLFLLEPHFFKLLMTLFLDEVIINCYLSSYVQYQRDFLNFSQDRPVLHLEITKDLKSDNHDGKYMFQ